MNPMLPVVWRAMFFGAWKLMLDEWGGTSPKDYQGQVKPPSHEDEED
jgi:hypothetical protein